MTAILQFKITLKDTGKPRVWRMINLPDTVSFHAFHRIIQAAFGWKNRHLYAFSPTGWDSVPFIAMPSRENMRTENIIDARHILLRNIFTNPGQRFTYMYDFGDEWEHRITLEQVIEAAEDLICCTDGRGNCPPEDCGGIAGYRELKYLFASGQPLTKYARDIRKLFGWKKGECWNADAFDLEAANRRIVEVLLACDARPGV
ncbi:MAG: plasmid pRiA4b ORF-3 family protein [Prevotellaceae bacterium]|jgi:hypothetical protein|nr:plasmid pRiA4b ORF-3 family protein [Prevotellaceae bacterium]